LSALPELPLNTVHKHADGSRYQIGDRIPLYVDLDDKLLQGQAHFAVQVPDGSSKIEDQGWYIDPQTLLFSHHLQFVVSPIQTGKLTLPTLLIVKEDKTPIARTAPMTIEVQGPTDEKKSKSEPELIDPVDISLATKYWVLSGGISVILIVAAIFLIRRLLRDRKRRRPILPPTTPSEPDHVLALRALEALYRKYDDSPPNLKPIAFGVSEILKHFFSNRFRIDASEATTDEMIALLKEEALPGDQLKEVLALFQDLDWVKFTKQTDFGERHYLEFKNRAQKLIQGWAHHEPSVKTGGDPS